MHLSSSLDHEVVRIVSGRFIVFTCPHKPSIELFFPTEGELHHCPICRFPKPIRLSPYQKAEIELTNLNDTQGSPFKALAERSLYSSEVDTTIEYTR